ncbi:MAG: Type IV-A pilus assembly ATPase PilB [Candidatus Magasanikbacteria bacterium GW2011_GWA2_46_17]|uniref:Type IV-A pilus assembly ATPase PilB n=1 Tax=Candidatus Magasanikbacteria bacterium GW2011_GWA2_46_17 TaxID=1619042 RepID=A0A0G1P3L5_9BACT|nr:MAG: Type IV-A pilus assembly ATPase PilB [Candidatus Magasanikbacteria bacterium GW2011_GWA2_46_17]
MSDFPSIQSLLKKSSDDSQPSGATDDVSGSAESKVAKKMAELEAKAKEKIAASQAAQFGMSYINLEAFPIPSEALRVVPLEMAEEKGLLCFYFVPGEMKVACVEPTDEVKEYAYQLGERHHASVEMFLISEHSLEKALKLYSNLPVVRPVSKDINITDEELNRYKVGVGDFRNLDQQFSNVSITDILTLMIAAALQVNSSDIHVEAEEKVIVMRYRIDGVLYDVASLPKEQWKKFVSRIKLLAALKINITDRPQDGRVTLRLTSGSLDVRVSTLPTVHGESVVMRILYSGAKGVTFDDLGLLESSLEKLRDEIYRPNGMVITTGPTGSGKTTTLYAVLRTLNKPGVKIITLEDPVEIKMEGINQSQIDSSRDYTFSKALRSVLRQDPDICMVGEIRDLETAEIAIQAALTGHLMLSTIHTNSAAGAIPRFLSMGVKPFLLAPSLNAIIGQRLVRKLCSHCHEEVAVPAYKLEWIKKQLGSLPEQEKKNVNIADLHFYHGHGCEQCSGVGYKGRVGIYEIFTMNKEIEQIILSNKVSEYEIQELAVKGGMITMMQDGLIKALAKQTSLEEVFRVAE